MIQEIDHDPYSQVEMAKPAILDGRISFELLETPQFRDDNDSGDGSSTE
jgi:hypothetical protein